MENNSGHSRNSHVNVDTNYSTQFNEPTYAEVDTLQEMYNKITVAENKFALLLSINQAKLPQIFSLELRL